MPIVSADKRPVGEDLRQSERALEVQSGLLRGFEQQNWAFLTELTLANGRRADLVALDEKGVIRIFEIKSSVEDLRADNKWTEYAGFCDAFYFATLGDVPADIFPTSEGFVVADRHGCEILREAEMQTVSAATRKAMMLRFGRTAAKRLLQTITVSNGY